jgi:hypothetical protein
LNQSLSAAVAKEAEKILFARNRAMPYIQWLNRPTPGHSVKKIFKFSILSKKKLNSGFSKLFFLARSGINFFLSRGC